MALWSSEHSIINDWGTVSVLIQRPRGTHHCVAVNPFSLFYTVWYFVSYMIVAKVSLILWLGSGMEPKSDLNCEIFRCFVFLLLPELLIIYLKWSDFTSTSQFLECKNYFCHTIVRYFFSQICNNMNFIKTFFFQARDIDR